MTEAVKPVATGPLETNILKGLLWREWLAHRNLLLGFLVAWLVLLWVLGIFFHPGFLIAFGVIFAFVVGPRLGGADAAEGSEEFSLSLPPTRSQRYLVRMGLGLVSVFLLTGLGSLAIWLDLPQRLWSLVVESGFTEPFPPVGHGFLYLLAVVAPLGVFAFTFAIASVANSRGLVAGAGLGGALSAAILLALGLLAEYLLWQTLNGYITCPALAAVSTMVLLLGYLAYVRRKEGISRPSPIARGGRGWWIAGIIVIAVIIMVIVLVLFALMSYHQVKETDRIRDDRLPVVEEVAPPEAEGPTKTVYPESAEDRPGEE